MEEQIDKKVLSILEKLISLKEGAEKVGSLHEAEVAFSKINEILLKHNLSLDDLEFKKPSEIEDEDFLFNWVSISKNSRKNEGYWYLRLYSVIAKHNLCSIIILSRNHKPYGVKFLGKRVNIDITKYVCEYLERYFLALAKQSWHGDGNRNTYIRSFLVGTVEGLKHKFEEERKAQIVNSQIYALVKNEQLLINTYINNMGANLTSRNRTSKVSDRSGLEDGFKVGKEVKINKGLENRNSFNQSLIG
jgi:hypothetical protein